MFNENCHIWEYLLLSQLSIVTCCPLLTSLLSRHSPDCLWRSVRWGVCSHSCETHKHTLYRLTGEGSQGGGRGQGSGSTPSFWHAIDQLHCTVYWCANEVMAVGYVVAFWLDSGYTSELLGKANLRWTSITYSHHCSFGVFQLFFSTNILPMILLNIIMLRIKKPVALHLSQGHQPVCCHRLDSFQ